MPKRKLKKFADLKLMPFVLEYPYDRLEREAFPFRGLWQSDFFRSPSPLTIELGCGGGEYTVDMAAHNPHGSYIGIDRKGARMWTGAQSTLKSGLSNVAFLRTDIDLINRFFAPREVAEIWITFPDPMMKKWRRRLVSSVYLAKYAQILSPDAVIHLKTDSPFLYQYTLSLLQVNGIRPLVETDDLYSDQAASLRASLPDVQTRYEKQWIARGLSIKYISFTLPAGQMTFCEPPEEPPHDDYRAFVEGSPLLEEAIAQAKKKL